MIIEEHRRISMIDLRNLCIARNWFNAGTNRDYYTFLRDASITEITVSELQNLAETIIKHTTSESLQGQELTSIMFDLARIAISTFEEVPF